MSQLICLAGLPGVGKTTWAREFMEMNPDFLYISPDVYYKRINGDDRNRSHPFEIWMAMFRDIHIAEINKRNVLIDSDNLTYAQRNQWIEWFPDFDDHILLFIEEAFDICMDRVSTRRRTIPEVIMREKMLKWENPFEAGDCAEWDRVCQIYFNKNNESIYIELKGD